MASFKDQTGAVALAQLDVDGNVPVTVMDDPAPDLTDFMAQMVWELQELRRVYCQATDQFYRKYQGE